MTEIGSLTIAIRGDDTDVRAKLARLPVSTQATISFSSQGLNETLITSERLQACLREIRANTAIPTLRFDTKSVEQAIAVNQQFTATLAAARAEAAKPLLMVRGPASGSAALDAGVAAAARGMGTLRAQLQRGAIDTSVYKAQNDVLSRSLRDVARDYGLVSREAATAERALNASVKSARSQALRQEAASVREATQSMNVYRMAWQRAQNDDATTLRIMEPLNAALRAQVSLYEQERAALQQKASLTGAEIARRQQLTALINQASQGLRTYASVEASIGGKSLKGSLAAGVAQGIREATDETTRLTGAFKAGLISSTEYTVQLGNHRAAMIGTLGATQAESAALRAKGAADAAETARLEALTVAEKNLTVSIAQATAAMEQQQVRQRAAVGGALGVRGAGGMNNAALAASFISPEIGGLAMAASLGPMVGGLALAATSISGIVKLTHDGQAEAKQLQQAYLSLGVNGVKDLGPVNKALDDLVAHGSTSDRSFTKPELAEGLALLSRNGFKGAEGLAALTTATRLAASENIPLNDAVKRLGSNLQHLELQGTDAASFGDKLVRASHLTQDSADSFSKGMNVMGFTGKALGLTVDEMLGFLVALSAKGLDPATIGSTGLRNAMQKIMNPGKEMKAVIAELGVALVDSTGHARSGRDIFMDLISKVSSAGPIYNQTTHKLMTANDLAAVNFELFGTRSATAFLGVQHGAKEATEQIAQSQGFLVHSSDEMASGLEGSEKRVTAAEKNLSLAFSQLFTPSVTSANEAFAGLLTRMTNGVQQFGQITGEIHKFVDAVAGTTTPLADLDKKLGEVGTPHLVALKINWKQDDGFKILMKLLAEGGLQIAIAAKYSAAGNQQNIDATVRTMDAATLRTKLVDSGLLEDLKAPWQILANIAQLRDVTSHMKAYQAEYADYLTKQPKLTVPGNSLTPLPAPKQNTLTGAGPLLPGQVRASSDTAGEALTGVFIQGVTGSIKGDPKLKAWCADVAWQVMNGLGEKLKYSANAAQLEKNAIAAGAVKVAPGQARRGDLVVYSGAGYGLNSGHHTEVVAGRQNGQLMLVGANTTATPTAKQFYDPQHATIYRLPSGGEAQPAALTPKSFEQYRKEAARIQAQIEKFSKGGANPNGPRYEKAKHALEQFTKQNQLAADAADWVSQQTDKVSKFGQAYDNLSKKLDITDSLKRNGASAADTTKALQGIQQAATKAANVELKSNGQSEKYAALIKLAGDAKEKIASFQKASNTADTSAATLAQRALQQGADLARRRQASDEETARLQQQALTRQRDNALKLAGDDAAGRLAIQKAFAPRIERAAEDEALAVLKTRKAANRAWLLEQTNQANQTLKGPALTAQLGTIKGDFNTENSNAYRAYGLAVGTAVDASATAQQAAANDVHEAVSKQQHDLLELTGSYEDARRKFQQKLISGAAISDGDVQEYLRSLAELWGKAGTEGLRGNPQIEALHAAAKKLADPATISGMRQAAQAYNDYWAAQDRRYGDGQGAADSATQQSYGVGADGLSAALKASGANSKLLSDPTAALADLERFNKGAADSIRRVYASELEAYDGSLKLADALRTVGRNRLERAHQAGDIGERQYLDQSQQLDTSGEEADWAQKKLTLTGPALEAARQLHEDRMTAIVADGVGKRKALDQQELEAFTSGLSSMGPIMEQLGGTAGVFGKSLSAAAGAIPTLSRLPALMQQTQSAFGAGGSLLDMLGSVGGWLSLGSTVLNIISSIGEAFRANDRNFQAWKKSELDLAAKQQAQAGSTSGLFDNPYSDRLTSDADARSVKANQSFLGSAFDWLTQNHTIIGKSLTDATSGILEDAAAQTLVNAASIFNKMAQGIGSSLSEGMMNAFRTADWTGSKEEFTKQVNNLLEGMKVDALIKASGLEKDMQQYADDAAAGKDTTADRARISAKTDALWSQYQGMATGDQGYGADAQNGVVGGKDIGTYTSGGGTSYSAVLPTSVTPPANTVSFSIPDTLLKSIESALTAPIGIFGTHVGSFGKHVDRLGGYVDRLGTGLTLTSRSGNGNL